MNLAPHITGNLLSFEDFVLHVEREFRPISSAVGERGLAGLRLNSFYLFHERAYGVKRHVFLRQLVPIQGFDRSTFEMVNLDDYPISLFGKESYELMCKNLLMEQESVPVKKVAMTFHVDSYELFHEYLYAIYQYNKEVFDGHHT